MFYEFVKNSAFKTEIFRSGLQIHVSPDAVLFRFSIDDGGEEPALKEHVVTLKDLRSLPGFTDMTTWLLPFDGAMNPLLLLNNNAESMQTKQAGTTFKTYIDSPLRVFFKVFYKSADFTNIGLRVMLPEGLEIESNVPFVEVVAQKKRNIISGEATPRRNRVVTPKIDGPSVIKANGIAELLVEPFWQGKALDAPVTVYLRHEAGYLPKSVIECNGKTPFKVHALGLEPGDKIEINAGFRFWSGEYYHTLEVV